MVTQWRSVGVQSSQTLPALDGDDVAPAAPPTPTPTAAAAAANSALCLTATGPHPAGRTRGPARITPSHHHHHHQMGRHATEYLLADGGRVYACRGCRQHIARAACLESRQFHSKQGRAYLFSEVVNVLLVRGWCVGVRFVLWVVCGWCRWVCGWCGCAVGARRVCLGGSGGADWRQLESAFARSSARKPALAAIEPPGKPTHPYMRTQTPNAQGPEEERLLTTGVHVVRDVACSRCLAALGWRYERAAEASQRYKEGKTILERGSVVAGRAGGGGGGGCSGRGGGGEAAHGGGGGGGGVDVVDDDAGWFDALALRDEEGGASSDGGEEV